MGYNMQHCLLLMLEKRKLAFNNNEAFGILSTDISKAVDCLSHDQLIAKLHSYGLLLTSLRLLSNYLSNYKQRIKVENVFNKWQNIETGVPQGSTLGPLLFNIFVCDLFLILDNTYFASYADDNTHYTINQNTDSVTKSLEELSITPLSWFKENKLKLNLDKCYLIVSGTVNAKIKLDDFTITNSKQKKLLGIIFDDKLKFQYHIENLCKKMSLKLSALSRVAPFVNLPQKKLFNAFFQLSYCPLVWMCHSRWLNDKINRLHRRCLRLIYNSKHSTLHEFLRKDCSVSIHTRNLQFRFTEMYKLAKDISPTIMQEIFRFRNCSRYNLTSRNYFEIPFRNFVYNGTELMSHLAQSSGACAR